MLHNKVASTIRVLRVKLVNSDNKTLETWIMSLDLVTFLLTPVATNHNGLPLKQVMNFKNLIIYLISFYRS